MMVERIDIADVAAELDAARNGCLVGREAAECSTIWRELHRLLTYYGRSEGPPALRLVGPDKSAEFGS